MKQISYWSIDVSVCKGSFMQIFQYTREPEKYTFSDTPPRRYGKKKTEMKEEAASKYKNFFGINSLILPKSCEKRNLPGQNIA